MRGADIAISAVTCRDACQEGARRKESLQHARDIQDGRAIVKTHVDLEARAATTDTLLRYRQDSGTKKSFLISLSECERQMTPPQESAVQGEWL